MRFRLKDVMQTLDQLNEAFALPGVLHFEKGEGGLLCALIKTAACRAKLYLQGAHLTHWQPAGERTVLFLSSKSAFAHGKAIRGGVPVIFPWFGARTAALTGRRTDGPSHGFARTSVWEVTFAAFVGDDVHLTLTLGPDENSRALGYDNFRVAYEVRLGRTLTMRLSVANTASGEGAAPLAFEEALHTYLAIGNAEQVRIHGLGETEYLDKTDGFKRKRQEDDVLALCGETDRPYLNTQATVTVEDPVFTRRMVVEKRGSATTVVWNPWIELAAKLPDMDDDGWKRMVCIETANAAENALTLRPGEAHIMEAHVRVEASGANENASA